MNEVVARPALPLWRRIVNFPLVAMVIAAVLFIFAAGIGNLIGQKALSPLQPAMLDMVADAAIILLLVLLTYKFAITRLGEHPRDDLRAKDAPRNLGIGLLAGALIMAAVVGVAAILDVYNIVGEGDASHLVAELVGAAIMPAFMEEIFFRGILQRWLEEFAGSWAGLGLASLAFGFAHYFNPNGSVEACLWIAIEAGVLLGGAYMLTRSLWMSIGLHAGWNLTQGEIFDVPVSGLDEHGLVQAKLSGPELLSGGQFGLEASVIALVIATAVGAWLVYLAVKRGQLMQPWWVRRRIARAAA